MKGKRGGKKTRNSVSGGTQLGPVLQGRDFTDITIITNQASAAPTALAQLPPLLTSLTGRSDELAQLATLLNPAAEGETVVVSAVAGLAGVGKTALAIHAAHAALRSDWFSGGVLFIDLHGYDQDPVQPGQALDALLRALGVPGEHIPEKVEQRAGLYRSELAESKEPVLIVIDNASSETQVRVLLPGPGSHRVLITSRHTLAGLGARLLDVNILDDEAGVLLLDKALRVARPRDNRVNADHEAALQLAGLCGGLPLALQITAAVLVAEPTLAVTDLTGELADEMHRLEVLQYDDGSGGSAPSVAGAFELSYRQLGEEAKLLFRLLPAHPGPDVSVSAAAALFGQSNNRTRRVIGQLAKAHLVEASAGGASRWRMHDLLRLYARRLSDTHSETDRRDQAIVQLLDYYVRSTHSADSHLRVWESSPAACDFKDRSAALAWLDMERESLIQAVVMAARLGHDRIAMELSTWLSTYLSWRRLSDDDIAVNSICLDATRRQRNRAIEAVALNSLSIALRRARRFDEAVSASKEAIALFRKIGDRQVQGMATNNLGTALREMERYKEAIRAHEKAAWLYRKSGDRHGEAASLNNLGSALHRAERFNEAIQAHWVAAAMYRETGDRHGEGSALGNLSSVLQGIGQFDTAIKICRKGIAIFRESGDRYGEGAALNNLGVALSGSGQPEEAVKVLNEAVAAFHEIGDIFREENALSFLQELKSRFDIGVLATMRPRKGFDVSEPPDSLP